MQPPPPVLIPTSSRSARLRPGPHHHVAGRLPPWRQTVAQASPLRVEKVRGSRRRQAAAGAVEAQKDRRHLR